MRPLVGNAMRAAAAAAVLSAPALPAAAQGVMYIPLGSKGEIAVIDTQRDTVIRKIPGVPAIHGLAGTPDGRPLFAGSMRKRSDGGTAVDLATGHSRRVDLAPRPYHVAAVRGAGKLYVASAGKPKAWIVDQNTLAALGEIDIGGKGHQMVRGVGG